VLRLPAEALASFALQSLRESPTSSTPPPTPTPHPPTNQIMKEDDANWPPADRVGKQELEIKLGGEHICFNTTKLGSVLQVQQSKDPDGLRGGGGGGGEEEGVLQGLGGGVNGS